MAAAEIDEISSELSPALTPVLLITHQACSEHLIKGHPEQPKRVGSIVEALVSNFNRDEMSIDYNPPRVTKPQLLRFKLVITYISLSWILNFIMLYLFFSLYVNLILKL